MCAIRKSFLQTGLLLAKPMGIAQAVDQFLHHPGGFLLFVKSRHGRLLLREEALDTAFDFTRVLRRLAGLPFPLCRPMDTYEFRRPRI